MNYHFLYNAFCCRTVQMQDVQDESENLCYKKLPLWYGIQLFERFIGEKLQRIASLVIHLWKSIHHTIFKSLIILLVIDIFNMCSTPLFKQALVLTEILHNSSASGWSGSLMEVLHLLLQDSYGSRMTNSCPN